MNFVKTMSCSTWPCCQLNSQHQMWLILQLDIWFQVDICLKTKTYNNFQPLIVPVNTIIQLSLIYPRYDWNWTDTDLHVQTVLHNRDVKLTLCFISSGFFWLTVTILTKDFWVDACSKIEALQTFFFLFPKLKLHWKITFLLRWGREASWDLVKRHPPLY